MKIVWDDQKLEDYAYQSEFGYNMNQLTKRNWMIGNILGGIVLGALMAWVLFAIPDTVFSEPTRMVLGILIAGITRFMENRAERSTKMAQAAMVLTFVAGMLIYMAGLVS